MGFLKKRNEGKKEGIEGRRWRGVSAVFKMLILLKFDEGPLRNKI